MASTVGIKIADILERYPAHDVLNAVADAFRERAGYLESNKLADATMQALAADYRSIAMQVTTAANLADDLLR